MTARRLADFPARQMQPAPAHSVPMKTSMHTTTTLWLQLLAGLVLGWAMAACSGSPTPQAPTQTQQAYRVAVDFSPYEGDQDPNTGAVVGEEQIGR